MRPPGRTPAGHRADSPNEELRLRFIKRAQALGFTLTEIKELLALRVDPNQSCKDVVRQIEAKALEVKAKIGHLRAIARTLEKMKSSCDGRCSVGECLILESLNSRRPS